MNRTLALSLTLAILLAHMLAIHKGMAGSFAPPYDEAHVTFRVARNLVETGSLAWDQGGKPIESFPSFLWLFLAAIGTRLGLTITIFCQALGTLSALVTVFVLARFSPGRLAGVIAPLLFVVSGGIAAAAASGAETATFGLFIAWSFLAYERKWRRNLVVALCLCAATREEGVAFAAMLFALELAGTLRQSAQPRISMLRCFAPVAVFVGLMALLRQQLFGSWISPFTHAWSSSSLERWLDGARYLADFARGSSWTILLGFPLYYFARGGLTGVGRRALCLSLGYCALVAGQGGGHGPMFQPLVPMIALLLIAIQESMTHALDSRRRLWPQLTWVLFLLALTGSALVSKYPGNLSVLPVDGLHRYWLRKSPATRLSYADPLGRLGVVEEIYVTERLRSLGGFMKGNMDFDAQNSLLTPWPGATGYLSRLRVMDALGRATLLPGESVPRPWSGIPRADVLALMGQAPDYIVPVMTWNDWREIPPTLHEIAGGWLRQIDNLPADLARSTALRDALLAYELITVPVPYGDSKKSITTRPFHLLRRRALEKSPKLEVGVEGRHFTVNVRHSSHEQLVDLRVLLIDSSGRTYCVLPTGGVREYATGMMRTWILLFKTDDRMIELAAGDFPDDLDVVEVRAVLRNPLARAEHPFALASEPITVRVER